MKMCCCSKLQK